MNGNPFGGMPSQNRNPFGGEQDLDELIKSIDKQIAALEEEEKKQKEEEAKKKAESENVIKDVEPVEIKDEVTSNELPKFEPIESLNKEIETRPIEQVSENAPKVSEVVHSNMVDLENFKLKENNNQEQEQTTEAKDNNNDYYDDFFDDFFDE